MLDQPDALIPGMLREIALRSCIAMQDYRRLWDSSVENGKMLVILVSFLPSTHGNIAKNFVSNYYWI